MKTALYSILLALLLTAGSSARGNDRAPLGRLFFTPEQREALDRQQDISASDQSSSSLAALTINGEIWRNGQRRVRWINGQSSVGNTTNATATPVGQTYHQDTGKSAGLLGNGRLIINPGDQHK